MSKKSKHMLRPATLYAALLLVVFLASWIGSVYEVRAVNRNSELVVNNLLDYQGMRWFFRNVTKCISDAPVADSLLLLMGLGVLSGSGLTEALRLFFSDRPGLSYRQRYALLLSLIPLALYVFMVFSGLFLGHRVLLGFSGGLVESPFISSGFFLLFLLLALPSVTYGLASGVFQSGDDIACALCMLLKRAASFAVSLFVASLLLGCIDYSGLEKLVGVSELGMRIVSVIVYWMPLAVILANNKRK